MSHAASMCIGQAPGDILSRVRAEARLSPSAWEERTLRQTFPGTAHHATRSIYIRWAPEWTVQSIFHTTDAVDCDQRVPMPCCRELIAAVADMVRATEIGRAMLVSLKPGGVIDPHYDEGIYADHFDRFHVPIMTNPSAVFVADGRAFHMRTGELWWFNHQRPHHAVNGGSEERVHLIVDCVAPAYTRARQRALADRAA